MLSQMVTHCMLDLQVDHSLRLQLFSYYGTFTRCQITMFEIHFDGYATPSRLLLDTCGEGYTYIFIAYRCFAGFAILNVINAVFVQQTMSTAEKDHEIMMADKESTIRSNKEELL